MDAAGGIIDIDISNVQVSGYDGNAAFLIKTAMEAEHFLSL